MEPGQNKGMTVDTLVEQIDIPATILDLAGIPVPPWMEGRSLTPLVRGGEIPDRPAFSMNFEGNPSLGQQISDGCIAVWEGDYKLIRCLGRDESLLFNLEEDPDETENLFDKEPETGQRLLTILQKNLNQANEYVSGGM